MSLEAQLSLLTRQLNILMTNGMPMMAGGGGGGGGASQVCLLDSQYTTRTN